MLRHVPGHQTSLLKNPALLVSSIRYVLHARTSMECRFAGPKHGKRDCWWVSYTSSVLLGNSMTTMLVHQLDQHYTSSNLHKPVLTNTEFMLVYAGLFSRVLKWLAIHLPNCALFDQYALLLNIYSQSYIKHCKITIFISGIVTRHISLT